MKYNRFLYKLKQFWIRRYMWRWCFDWWFRVMYPHIYYSEYGETYNEYISVDDMWWFWEYLNNLGGVNDD